MKICAIDKKEKYKKQNKLRYLYIIIIYKCQKLTEIIINI